MPSKMFHQRLFMSISIPLWPDAATLTENVIPDRGAIARRPAAHRRPAALAKPQWWTPSSFECLVFDKVSWSDIAAEDWIPGLLQAICTRVYIAKVTTVLF